MTRLLNTPIIGASVEIVDSSWIDMLAGLSRCGILRMPPDFCAWAAGASDSAISATAATANPPRFRRISSLPLRHVGRLQCAGRLERRPETLLYERPKRHVREEDPEIWRERSAISASWPPEREIGAFPVEIG